MSAGHRVAIWNPVSGGALDEAALRVVLGDGVEIVETTAEDPGAGMAADAVADDAELVVACGGDGTVRACLDALAGSRTALAVVPLGTGNLLAANLGIPDGEKAAATVGGGARRTIDLGRVNGEAFAVMAGTGFDALMIRDADPVVKSTFGSLAYVVSGLRHLRGELVPTAIEVDGEPWLRGRTSMVLVGNFGTITGGIEVFPDALPDDGLLELAVVTATTWREWAAIGRHLVLGRPAPEHLVRRTRGRRFVIEHARPREYELDGEVRDATIRLEVEVEPAALTLHQGRSDADDCRADVERPDRGLTADRSGYDGVRGPQPRTAEMDDTRPPMKGPAMSTDASVIEDLVQTLEDGREGYAKAADRLDGTEHSQFVMMFREFSAQRDRFAAELRNLRPGEDADSDGTLLGDLHRGWMALKDALTGDSVEAVLKAVTTGENHAVSEYDKALDRDPSATLRAIVERQRAEVVEARNRVETLASARA